MKKSEIFLKAVAAGILIGMGSTVYLAIENRVVGSLLFCVGLFSICVMGMNLFTGKIAYVFEQKNVLDLSIIWVGNLVGSFICSLPMRLIKPQLAENAVALVNAKFALNPLAAFILSVFCGILVYIAVENFRNGGNDFAKVVGIFICVPAFILCGFEHSIANMSYCIFAVNDMATFGKAVLLILTATVGNGIGAVAFRWLMKSR